MRASSFASLAASARFDSSGRATTPEPIDSSIVFITIPRKPRVLKLMTRFVFRSRKAAVAATRFDSCQMAKTACPWKTGGPEVRAVAATSVVALVDLPIHWLLFGFERMIAFGLLENLLQAVVQGIFAGALSTYLFTRAVVLLGAGRAAVFPSLVPGFTLLIGFLALGEVPSLAQLAGFAIVLIGFRLTQT